jgi:flagellar assembly factor FliW
VSAVDATQLRLDTRFGSFDAAARDVIDFAGGLPGFERCERYVLVGAPSLHPFTCLQGLDDSKPSFLVIDPRLVDRDYLTALSPSDYRRIEASPQEALLWMVIVRIEVDNVPVDNVPPEKASSGNVPENASGEYPESVATVNLRAPIVVNPRRMIGIQALPHESPYRHDHPLHPESPRAGLHA